MGCMEIRATQTDMGGSGLAGWRLEISRLRLFICFLLRGVFWILQSVAVKYICLSFTFLTRKPFIYHRVNISPVRGYNITRLFRSSDRSQLSSSSQVLCVLPLIYNANATAIHSNTNLS